MGQRGLRAVGLVRPLTRGYVTFIRCITRQWVPVAREGSVP